MMASNRLATGNPSTRIVVGLGNAERQYQRTRHNLGARAVGEAVARLGLHVAPGLIAVPMSRSGFVLPVGFMNDSGEIVLKAVERWGPQRGPPGREGGPPSGPAPAAATGREIRGASADTGSSPPRGTRIRRRMKNAISAAQMSKIAAIVKTPPQPMLGTLNFAPNGVQMASGTTVRSRP